MNVERREREGEKKREKAKEWRAEAAVMGTGTCLSLLFFTTMSLWTGVRSLNCLVGSYADYLAKPDQVEEERECSHCFLRQTETGTLELGCLPAWDREGSQCRTPDTSCCSNASYCIPDPATRWVRCYNGTLDTPHLLKDVYCDYCALDVAPVAAPHKASSVRERTREKRSPRKSRGKHSSHKKTKEKHSHSKEEKETDKMEELNDGVEAKIPRISVQGVYKCLHSPCQSSDLRRCYLGRYCLSGRLGKSTEDKSRLCAECGVSLNGSLHCLSALEAKTACASPDMSCCGLDRVRFRRSDLNYCVVPRPHWMKCYEGPATESNHRYCASGACGVSSDSQAYTCVSPVKMRTSCGVTKGFHCFNDGLIYCLTGSVKNPVRDKTKLCFSCGLKGTKITCLDRAKAKRRCDRKDYHCCNTEFCDHELHACSGGTFAEPREESSQLCHTCALNAKDEYQCLQKSKTNKLCDSQVCCCTGPSCEPIRRSQSIVCSVSLANGKLGESSCCHRCARNSTGSFICLRKRPDSLPSIEERCGSPGKDGLCCCNSDHCEPGNLTCRIGKVSDKKWKEARCCRYCSLDKAGQLGCVKDSVCPKDKHCCDAKNKCDPAPFTAIPSKTAGKTASKSNGSLKAKKVSQAKEAKKASSQTKQDAKAKKVVSEPKQDSKAKKVVSRAKPTQQDKKSKESKPTSTDKKVVSKAKQVSKASNTSLPATEKRAKQASKRKTSKDSKQTQKDKNSEQTQDTPRDEKPQSKETPSKGKKTKESKQTSSDKKTASKAVKDSKTGNKSTEKSQPISKDKESNESKGFASKGDEEVEDEDVEEDVEEDAEDDEAAPDEDVEAEYYEDDETTSDEYDETTPDEILESATDDGVETEEELEATYDADAETNEYEEGSYDDEANEQGDESEEYAQTTPDDEDGSAYYYEEDPEMDMQTVLGPNRDLQTTKARTKKSKGGAKQAGRRKVLLHNTRVSDDSGPKHSLDPDYSNNPDKTAPVPNALPPPLTEAEGTKKTVNKTGVILTPALLPILLMPLLLP